MVIQYNLNGIIIKLFLSSYPGKYLEAVKNLAKLQSRRNEKIFQYLNKKIKSEWYLRNVP